MEFENNIPIYIQVINQIKKDIITGKLPMGAKLPSTRELAVLYHINPNTAGRVYKEMELQNMCYTKRGLGTFVTEDAAVFNALRESMAQEFISNFIKEMQIGEEFMLNCSDVKKTYFNKTAVENISLSLENGKIYALLGPNGSGKTTFMKMIAGLVKPTSGTILYENEPIGVQSKREIAYLPTESFFYSFMTVKDVGIYYRDFFEDFDMEKYAKLIADMDLRMEDKASKLSSGMAAKLKIAATLARAAKLYLLDEPLNGIDIIAREKIITTIINAVDDESTVVISSHLVDELEAVVDSVIFIKEGRNILQGEAEQLREQHSKSIVELYKEIYA